jgi:hypothetical protein
MKKQIALLLLTTILWACFIGCKKELSTNNNTTQTTPDDEVVEMQPNPASDFEYEVTDNGKIKIKKYVGDGTQVIIPKAIDEKEVAVIGDYAFAGTNIVSLVMPDTVVYISSAAFLSCEALTSIKMSAALITIGELAFRNCTSLTTIDLSMDSLTYIGEQAFYGCENLKTVKFGDNIQQICAEAFFQCTSLEEAILPKNLKEIGYSAFLGCQSIQKVWVPKTIETWGYSTFHGATALTEIIFEEGLKQIGPDSGVFCYGAQIQSVRIPASVEVISEAAFMDCNNLKAIHFAGPAPQIGSNQFLDFVSPTQDVTIYYNPSMSGWDTTPLKDIYTLIPLS